MEAKKTDIDNLVGEISELMEGYCKPFADIADNFDWDAYTADLAKEMAVNIVKSTWTIIQMRLANTPFRLPKRLWRG